MGVVEVAEIRSVERDAGEKGRGERGEGTGRVLEQGRSGGVVTANKVSAVTGGFNNCIRAAAVVGKFGDNTSGGIAIDLDAGHD
jgi:hypothetical protein